MTYILTIYEYPTCSGSPGRIFETTHQTPRAAIAALDEFASDYWLATLGADDGYGHVRPCGPNGELCYHPEFTGGFERRGKNGTHPARMAMIQDWRELVKLTRDRFDPANGLIAAARAVLLETHPSMVGCAEELAQAAYGPSEHNEIFVPSVDTVLNRMETYGETLAEAERHLGGVV